MKSARPIGRRTRGHISLNITRHICVENYYSKWYLRETTAKENEARRKVGKENEARKGGAMLGSIGQGNG